MSSPSLAVLMTIHNRREASLACLQRLFAQSLDCQMTVIILDDGSSDGSKEAIKEAFPEVRIIQGDGNYYWNRGMHHIFGEALGENYDLYLWLNDDTYLYPHALQMMVESWQAVGPKAIIAGGTLDPEKGVFSYGGFVRRSRWTLKLEEVGPTQQIQAITTMHGNCVLIPREVAQVVGNIEPFYRHRWGDPDYGLRAQKLGCRVYLAPEFVGDCPSNPLAEAWTDPERSFGERLADFHSIKGYGKQDWFFYVRRHGGLLWPLLWLKPYWDMLLNRNKRR